MNQQKLVHGHKPISAPENVTIWDVDPYDENVLTNEREFFRELLEKGPFSYLPKYAMLACGRYDVTREVFADHERFVSSRGVGLSDFKLEEPWRPPSIVLEVDPPYHTKTRRVIMRALSPKVVRELQEEFNRDAELLLDEVLASGEVEAVTALAEAFPTRVFPKAVGIKEPDRRKLIDYGAMVFNAIGPDNQLRKNSMGNAADIVPWINAQCARSSLTEHGIGAAIYEAADDGQISEEEAGMLVRSLLSAGVDTTVTAIGNAIWCFANNPDEFEKLRQNPEGLALSAFEETLRYTSPVQAFCRTAGVDTEVAGIKIEECSKILCVLGAANMDPDKWENPEKFDITRNAMGHLALGVGIHGCVGQNIARAEGQAVIRAIGRKVKSIELNGTIKKRPNNAILALDRLPVRMIAN